MGEEIEIAPGGEIYDLLDQRALRGIAVDVEFADAAEIAALVLGLDQIVDRRIARPVLHVVAGAIGTDERHHPEPRRLGVDELVGALVGAAVRQDAGDAVAAEDLEHPVERIVRIWLLIVVQVRVEDLQRRLRNGAGGHRHDRGHDRARNETQCRHGAPSAYPTKAKLWGNPSLFPRPGGSRASIGDSHFSGRAKRMCSSRNCFGVTSDGAPIIRSSARWFIGNSTTSRRFSSPASSITMRSMPGAMPPCGGAPSESACSMPPNFCSSVFSP